MCVALHTKLDRDGLPHSFHCIRVCMTQTEEPRMIAALLHDVLEDCGMHHRAEIEREFGHRIALTVDFLTRAKEQTWSSYIKQVMEDEHPKGRWYVLSADHLVRRRAHEDAMHIKMADIEDNVSPRRLDEKMRKQLPMYHEAYMKIARRLGYTDKVLPLI